MLLTADHDDRVVPLHSLKLLAVSPLPIIYEFIYFASCKILTYTPNIYQTMQHVLVTSLDKSPQTNPIIARIECKAGHGAGRPTQKTVINLFLFRLPFSIVVLLSWQVV
jgi:prolyl oligopeptidase